MPEAASKISKQKCALFSALFFGLTPLLACEEQALFVYENLPSDIAPPKAPDDNPTTEQAVALGDALFHDPALSFNNEVSCATCHDDERAFSEARKRSIGATGVEHMHNAPTLLNTGYSSSYGWANPSARSLERHAAIPLFGEEPIEMGATLEVIDAIALKYEQEMHAAFGAEAPALQNIINALAAFQRTLVDFDSAFDEGTLTNEESEGFLVFENKGCVQCHTPPFFTDAIAQEPFDDRRGFHNNGTNDDGLFAFTFIQSERGLYKTPTLRQVSKTSPYMHDGRFETLEEVLQHYQDPGEGSEISSVTLSESEEASLLAFLRSL